MRDSNLVLEDLLLSFANPDKVKSSAVEAFNEALITGVNVVPWRDLSLSGGYPSILLLFSVLEQEALIPDGISHLYVLKIKNSIESDGIESCSLFDGLAGICFSLEVAAGETSRYERMRNTLNNHLLSRLEKEYFSPLDVHFVKSTAPKSHLYDLVQGLVGVGRYILEYRTKPGFDRAVRKILNYLIQLTNPINIQQRSVPGWYLAVNDPLNVRAKKQYSKGNFNLGLAHGVPGILAFLSIALQKGVEVGGQKVAIKLLAQWISSKVVNGPYIQWPNVVSWEEEVLHKRVFGIAARDGWCYGVPGIARSLFLAGKALKDNSLKSYAMKAFCQVFDRKRDDWGLPGPMLCHGIAGLYLITKEMCRETGGEILFDQIEALEKILLSNYSEEAIWGFKDIDFSSAGKRTFVNRPGLLEGSSGILLSLLPIQDGLWKLPFLI